MATTANDIDFEAAKAAANGEGGAVERGQRPSSLASVSSLAKRGQERHPKAFARLSSEKNNNFACFEKEFDAKRQDFD